MKIKYSYLAPIEVISFVSAAADTKDITDSGTGGVLKTRIAASKN